MKTPRKSNTKAPSGTGDDAQGFASPGELARAPRAHGVPTAEPVYERDGSGDVCDHFQSDGRGCCRHCGHFHGRMEG